MLLKIQYILKGILVISVIASISGIAIGDISSEMQSDRVVALSGGFGCGVFGGQIVPIPLKPQPDPPKVYKIGVDTCGGVFSGQITWLSPQPEPPDLPIIA